MVPSGNNLIVTYTSYLILKQASPEVKPHILYDLVFGGNRETLGEVAGIDYGPAGRIFGQHVAWEAICDNAEKGFNDPITFWRQLLGNKERADEDVLHDAWKGPGNMWVFVRPDRYVEGRSLAEKADRSDTQLPHPRDPYCTPNSQFSIPHQHGSNRSKFKTNTYIPPLRHPPFHMRIPPNQIYIHPNNNLQNNSRNHHTTRKRDRPASTYRG